MSLSSKPASGGNRLAYVDSIRALAALGVIYFHMAWDHYDDPLTLSWEKGLFFVAAGAVDLGKVAVTLFFFVSGFVVPFSLLHGRANAARTFIISRVFRLYPAYWVSAIAAAVFVIGVQGTEFSSFALVANALMLQDFLRQPSLQGLYWTLQIELIFYFFCLVMFLTGLLQKVAAVRNTALLLLTGALVLAAGRYATGIALPVALPLALFVMFVGMLWRLHLIEGVAEARRALTLLVGLFVPLFPVIAVLAYSGGGGPGIPALRYIVTYYAAFALFFLLTTRWRIETPLFAWLGALSYSIYLFGGLTQRWLLYLLHDRWPEGLPLHILLIPIYAITIAAAALVYNMVERPAIRLGRSLMVRLDLLPARREQIAEVI